MFQTLRRYGRGAAAMGALIRNPKNTRAVFVIKTSLSTKAFHRHLQRWRTTPIGQRVLEERSSLLTALNDIDALQAMPYGSLGKLYSIYLIEAGLTQQGLADVSSTELGVGESDFELFVNRYRDMHDLCHTVTRYKRDALGEVCQQGFDHAQDPNAGTALIWIAGTISQALARRSLKVFAISWEARRLGKASARFIDADWEALLSLSMSTVRLQLKVPQAVHYKAWVNKRLRTV
ncbi:MAG: Coq4 family protein [Luminiphilus sp.]|nr:Coq4 family protein [Luminiphilus sp.]